MSRRYKGQSRTIAIPPGFIEHDGSGCPVPPDSKPGVLLRIGTRCLAGKRWADEWSAMEGGDCWTWKGKRPQPLDIVAYEPENEFDDVPHLGAAR